MTGAAAWMEEHPLIQTNESLSFTQNENDT